MTMTRRWCLAAKLDWFASTGIHICCTQTHTQTGKHTHFPVFNEKNRTVIAKNVLCKELMVAVCIFFFFLTGLMGNSLMAATTVTAVTEKYKSYMRVSGELKNFLQLSLLFVDWAKKKFSYPRNGALVELMPRRQLDGSQITCHVDYRGGGLDSMDHLPTIKTPILSCGRKYFGEALSCSQNSFFAIFHGVWRRWRWRRRTTAVDNSFIFPPTYNNNIIKCVC